MRGRDHRELKVEDERKAQVSVGDAEDDEMSVEELQNGG